MILAYIQIDITLPYVSSLKGRRKIIHSIKERLRKLNCSILDISREYAKEAALAIALLAHDKKEFFKKLQIIEDILEDFIGEIEYSIDYEII